MSENNILDYFEKEKSIKFPAHIKNLLIFSGFDNKISLSKLENEDIAEIEKLGREIIPKIIEKSQQEKYLGYFKNNPQQFCIFSGHKKLLQELSQFYKNFSYKKRLLFDENHSKKLDQNPQNDSKRPRDVNSEKQNIYNLLMNWINNFCSRHLTYEEATHVSREITKTKVEISSDDINQCFVTCCICLKEFKIFRNQNGFWIMSNIHKHFKTHMNLYSNKKFSKNICISRTISNNSHEVEPTYSSEYEMKQENHSDEN